MNIYLQWLLAQRKRDDPIGDLAKDAFMDVQWDGSSSHLKSITCGTPAEATFLLSLSEFRQQRKKY